MVWQVVVWQVGSRKKTKNGGQNNGKGGRERERERKMCHIHIIWL